MEIVPKIELILDKLPQLEGREQLSVRVQISNLCGFGPSPTMLLLYMLVDTGCTENATELEELLFFCYKGINRIDFNNSERTVHC